MEISRLGRALSEARAATRRYLFGETPSATTGSTSLSTVRAASRVLLSDETSLSLPWTVSEQVLIVADDVNRVAFIGVLEMGGRLQSFLVLDLNTLIFGTAGYVPSVFLDTFIRVFSGFTKAMQRTMVIYSLPMAMFSPVSTGLTVLGVLKGWMSMIFGWIEMSLWTLISPGGFMGLINAIKYSIIGGDGPNPYMWSTYSAMFENG